MANIINITERGNRLDITDTYTPIVCGNSNYELHFDFSDEWSKCNKKTAVFFVNGKKTAVEFEGDTVEVPILPNAPFVYVALITSNSSNEQLASTQLRLRLESTPLLDETKEFSPLQNYLASILGTINNIESGNLTVKKAEIAENVVNSNFLINGDFKVNQRGNSVYTNSGYSVDRWQIGNGFTLSVQENGVNITTTTNGWFQQKLENKYSDFAGKEVTLSAKINGKIYSVSGKLPETEPTSQIDLIRTNIGNNGGTNEDALRITYLNERLSVNIYMYANSTLHVDWIKLEEGSVATKFIPRLYAEELALCQRYYQVVKSNYGGTNLNFAIARSTSIVRIFVNLLCTLRTTPTVKNSNVNLFKLDNQQTIEISNNTLTVQCISNNQCVLNFVTTNIIPGTTYFVSDSNGLGKYELDAEIY